MFTAQASETLLTSAYTISNSADRMGVRLDGPELAHAGSSDIVSDGTAPGSIQVPGSGQPIVLLADRQTTGGYPKIATIISTDLPVLARRRPGDRVEFEAVDVAEALAIRTEHVRWLEASTASIVTGRDSIVSLVELLYGENLISGVTAGAD
jgi:allophanate hydrolase subunit 2